MKSEINRDSYCVFRIPPESGRVIWEITNRCNYGCSYCGFTVDKAKREEELDTTEVLRTLEGLKQNGFTHIKFTGGEPLVRKDLIEILERATQLGFVSDLSTNASLVTPEVARQLASLNLKMVHSSIDGQNQIVHESLRGPNTYQRTLRGVQELIKAGLYVRIGSLVHAQNEYHLEAMVGSIAALGVNEIIFSYLEPDGPMKDDHSQVARRPAAELRADLEQLSLQYPNLALNHSFTEAPTENDKGLCPGGRRVLFINNLGQVAPCTWLIFQQPQYWSERSLKHSTVDEVLASAPLQEFQRYLQHYAGGCPIKKK